MDKLAVLAPVDVGENMIWAEQLDEGGSVWPEQVSLCLLNCPGLVPVRDSVHSTRLPVPTLETVNIRGADELPTLTEPKL
jgi:hypothetical protein